MSKAIRYRILRATDKRRVTFRGINDEGVPQFTTSVKGCDTYPRDVAESLGRWYWRVTGKLCDTEVVL